MPLKRPDIEKGNDDTFLILPQSPIIGALKTDFDRPIKNLIDNANSIIELIPKNEKQDVDKFDLHLSDQLSKLFPKVQDGSASITLDNDADKINGLPIPTLPDILSKIDKGEVPKQLEFFEGGQNREFENKVKLIGLSADSIEYLEIL